VVWPVVLAGLVAGFGNLVNDYFDAEIDRVNKPRRPIPSGRLSRRFVAWVYGVGTVALTLVVVGRLRPPVLALMIAWEVLLFYYAASAKRAALLGNVLISSVCASAFVAGALVAGRHDVVVFPAAFAFVFVMGREFVKSAEDVEGDRAVGARTLAVRCGAERTAAWGAALLCACAAVSPLPTLVGYFGRGYALLMEFLVVPGVLAAAYMVLRSPSRSVFHRASWILKVEMLAGIVVVGLGRTGW
jgi:geranylgeranylglycerol-phosphate geranylgeranyltransferase